METPSEAIVIRDLWKIYSRKKDLRISSSDVENEERVEELDKGEDAVVAMKNVSLSVNRGETFIIMGLSGSGKSTLIRCLIRLVEPTSGEIIVNGENVTMMHKRELVDFRREKIAMVFQHYGLLPHRTVLDNVCFGLKLRGEEKEARRAKGVEALEQVGLKGWEKYYPASLSGGMRQRVGIARALVMDASILLMDEPFSGLDPLIRRELQDEMIRLQKEMHKTIFFVTHDLSEALRMGDRMAIMKKGEIVQVGSPDEVIASPADEYVAKFVQDERDQVQRAEQVLAREHTRKEAEAHVS
ncbi:MAG: betaine/proline/choline family ABC transporter ATP-binding protein [Synergistaceae bacterium]|nr:betaine/proline/choline family ABC transporter ATP-binding protein [Synergistaceae bacterium]MDD3917194.1 betaine/proline/choline family ABC transporter ATP-binding protein [Synergistaceae bacterium]NLD96634.1 betaine/proline/choline family ABC transporter ATP-binding protein [Synergistaceae bacterium]HOO88499.1 betaine/proline/choline family ABC transporter ATP-binding protein [Synergistales bacterium]